MTAVQVQPSITSSTTVIGSIKPTISSCQSFLLTRLLWHSASRTTDTGFICSAKNSSPTGPTGTFTGLFLCWLYTTYGSWSGVEMKNGHAEGAIRHQTTKTHPVLNLSLNKTLRSFSYAIDGTEGKEANLRNFKKTVNSLNEFVGGSGNLLNKNPWQLPPRVVEPRMLTG
jgi:hypothetical protein